MEREMARIILFIFFLNVNALTSFGQNEKWDHYLYVDSVLSRQISNGQLSELIEGSEKAIQAGTRYPRLFNYRGYALLYSNQPLKASFAYLKALKLNRYNRDAQLGWYLSNLEMNQGERGAYFGYNPQLNDSSIWLEKVNFKLISSLGFDLSLKSPQNEFRENARYAAFAVRTQLSHRLYLNQQVAYYRQTVALPDPVYQYDQQGLLILPVNYQNAERKIKQNQYYAKLNYVLLPNVQLFSSLQKVKIEVAENTLKGYAISGGLNYQINNFSIGANLSDGKLYDIAYRQYHLQGTWYPFGNLSYYATAGFSFLRYNNSRQNIPDLSIGAKLSKKIWLESNLIYGNYNNLLFSEGSIWFNTLDQGLFRTGASIIYKLNPQFGINLHYHWEKFDNLYLNQTTQYYQHSITTGLLWKL
jgi:hypothetical protein